MLLRSGMVQSSAPAEATMTDLTLTCEDAATMIPSGDLYRQPRAAFQFRAEPPTRRTGRRRSGTQRSAVSSRRARKGSESGYGYILRIGLVAYQLCKWKIRCMCRDWHGRAGHQSGAAEQRADKNVAETRRRQMIAVISSSETSAQFAFARAQGFGQVSVF